MARVYLDDVQVRLAAEGTDLMAGGMRAPEVFLWQGRLHVVREVLAHWRSRQPWWRQVAEGRSVAEPDLESHVWRVEASQGWGAPTGVYDLVGGSGGSAGQWRLHQVSD